MQPRKIQLGKLLVEEKIINQEQLQEAIDIQKKTGDRLGNILIEKNYITENTFLSFLAKQLGIPFIDLKHYPLNQSLALRLDQDTASRFNCILLEETQNGYLVGMTDPQDIFAYDELTRILRAPIKLALVEHSALMNVFTTIYRHTKDIRSYAEELSHDIQSFNYEIDQLPYSSRESDTPVVKLLQSMFEDAIQVHASDIHIEPDRDVLRIRQRIDGVLHEETMEDVRIASPLTVRLKLMARLNIAERRLPQDGRFTLRVHGKDIDVRLSTMPMQNGESVVMRLLDRTNMLTKIEQLKLPPDKTTLLKQLIDLPYGMILVTGPTGSGKTSTLYAMLNELNKPDYKIITVEDPVEYRLNRVNQVQVNFKIDLDFARILRSTLRQDPDVIMVGEIRDKETAKIALRAATTGHLVLATMHTNDIYSSIIRLLDMETESYLIGSSLSAVIAQRLMRKICEGCITDYEPNEMETKLVENITHTKITESHFKYGKGCRHCNETGYLGRIGAYEILPITQIMAQAISNQAMEEFNKLLKQSHHTRLIEYAIQLAQSGITTLEEVLRLNIEIEVYQNTEQ